MTQYLMKIHKSLAGGVLHKPLFVDYMEIAKVIEIRNTEEIDDFREKFEMTRLSTKNRL